MLARVLAMFFAVALTAACSGVWSTGPTGPEPAETLALPGPSGAPPLAAATVEPQDIPGVDTSTFSRREKERFWRLVTQLYAPCSDQAVSLAACVKEKRPCSGCAPALNLIAARIHAGGMAEDAQAAYAARFGPNVKSVEILDSPARGPEGAPVTIVEWFDFECPHCRMTLPMLDRLYEDFPGKIRLVKKFYPLRGHSRAEPAARAAIAAMNQNKFWAMERLLFRHPTELADTDFEKYAAELKLDVARFDADMKAEKTLQTLARDRADADRLGLSGTPFILINGRDFDLNLFHLEGDLEAWIKLEVELKGGDQKPIAAELKP